MLSSVLRSQRAVHVNILIMRAFVKMRAALSDTRDLARKLAALENELKERLNVHEAAIVTILQRVMDIIDPPALPAPPIEWFVLLGGGLAQELVEARPDLGRREPLFPNFIVLPGEQEASEVSQLRLFLRWQSLTDLNQFRRGLAHATLIPATAPKLKTGMATIAPSMAMMNTGFRNWGT